MKTKPWHSTEQKHSAYEHKETVHHDNTSCAEGGNITKEHLKLGTNSRPLCKECARLNAEGDLLINQPDRNLTINLEHLLQALRGVQSLTLKTSTTDARTQIDLPESIMTRTREEALGMGVAPEILIMALLQVFHDADAFFKNNLSKELDSVLHAGAQG